MGKTPYPALDPPTLLRMLKEGHRLENPENAACSPEMYASNRTMGNDLNCLLLKYSI